MMIGHKARQSNAAHSMPAPCITAMCIGVGVERKKARAAALTPAGCLHLLGLSENIEPKMGSKNAPVDTVVV
jgi:hypothetical protein